MLCVFISRLFLSKSSLDGPSVHSQKLQLPFLVY